MCTIDLCVSLGRLVAVGRNGEKERIFPIFCGLDEAVNVEDGENDRERGRRLAEGWDVESGSREVLCFCPPPTLGLPHPSLSGSGGRVVDIGGMNGNVK